MTSNYNLQSNKVYNVSGNNQTITITPDNGFDGMSQVTLSVYVSATTLNLDHISLGGNVYYFGSMSKTTSSYVTDGLSSTDTTFYITKNNNGYLWRIWPGTSGGLTIPSNSLYVIHQSSGSYPIRSCSVCLSSGETVSSVSNANQVEWSGDTITQSYFKLPRLG